MKANQKYRQNSKNGVTPVLGTLLVLPVVMLVITAMMTWAGDLINSLQSLQSQLRETSEEINKISINTSKFGYLNIVKKDSFEAENIQWNKTSNLSSSKVKLAQFSYYTRGDEINTAKGQSLKIETGPGGYCGIYKPFPDHEYGNISISAYFTVSPKEKQKIFNIRQNESKNNATIKLDLEKQKLYVYNESGGYKEISDDFSICIDDKCWNHMELTVNFSSGKYVNFILNDIEYDLGNYTLNNPSPGMDALFYNVTYLTQAKAEKNAKSYFDDFVFRDLDFFKKIGFKE
ncbi:MAG: hypothetical protein V5A64_01455 [Candidatus Thermoplasmatota archaeon]